MIHNIPPSIIALGQATLGKVADKFVDFVITKYTGKSIKVFEAEGDIEADKVKTKWEVLEKPFWLQAEAVKMNRQYLNFGNTLLKAVPFITESENNIKDDNDFFWGLLEHSKEISNGEMQELIAKIIAGEYNKPGLYAMSTLHSIKMLGKEELALFERISSLIINGDGIPTNIFSLPENVKGFISELKIDFGSLQILQNLGLFLPNEMSMHMENTLKKVFALTYFEKEILFEPTHENNFSIKMPACYGLSITGKQILRHLNPRFNQKYFSWLKENYKIPNYKVKEENKIQE